MPDKTRLTTAKIRKHPLKMLIRMLHLLLFESNQTDCLVEKSYDRISPGYDKVWTNHMRDCSEDLIGRLAPKRGDSAIDLTCGTGFVTNLIAARTAKKVIGVDKSEGMLNEARKNYGQCCEFVNSDILDFLKTLPANSVDIVTCCWGLGYTKPFAVLRQIKRVLKRGGKVGIIDNSLYSLIEISYCAFLTYLERPDKMATLIRPKFLPRSFYLGLWWLIFGMKPIWLWGGKKSYTVSNGKEAVSKLRATGAAAGFEHMARPEDADEIYQRLAEIIEQKLMKENTITITHRYLAGIGEK
jgi:ubiquinone/menaquinone biosynthesis C-methylase UbiE